MTQLNTMTPLTPGRSPSAPMNVYTVLLAAAAVVLLLGCVYLAMRASALYPSPVQIVDKASVR
jgi:hypothetical protein